MRIGQPYVYNVPRPQGDAANAPSVQAAYQIALAEIDGQPTPAVLASGAGPGQDPFLNGWDRTGQALDSAGGAAARGAVTVGSGVWNATVSVGSFIWKGARAVGSTLWHATTAVAHGAGSLLAGVWHGVTGLFRSQPAAPGAWGPIPGLPAAPGQPGLWYPAPGQPGGYIPPGIYPGPISLPPVPPPAPLPPPPPPAPLPPLAPLPAPAPRPVARPKPVAKHRPKPVARPKHKPGPKPVPSSSAVKRLEQMSPATLAHLGATNKQAFFDALRPAAEEAQKKYGVPAAVTLAQAALETGWGAHLAAGYNLFGIKGTGPAGTNRTQTREVVNGRSVTVQANFAKYHNFYEGVQAHGQIFHNGYYNKAVNNYARTHSAEGFARDITGVYATDPTYGSKLIQIMRQYHLE